MSTTGILRVIRAVLQATSCEVWAEISLDLAWWNRVLQIVGLVYEERSNVKGCKDVQGILVSRSTELLLRD